MLNSWHSQNHVIEIRIEGFSLWNINSIRSFEVVSSQNIVDVVQTTRSFVDFTEIGWPNTSISIFCLFFLKFLYFYIIIIYNLFKIITILTVISRVDSVVYNSISICPFLVIVLFEMMVAWIN